MKKTITAGLAGLAGLLIAALPAMPPASAAEAADGSCEHVTISVAMPTDQQISGTLCTPAGWAEGPRQVDVLVHGATYDSSYWHWPLDTGRYSQTKRITDAGRAAFRYDRPGTGGSSRPPSAALTVAADVRILHQMIQWLRGRQYERVTVVGHSLGSVIAISEAATYNDLHRLVITGMIHFPGLGPDALGLFTSFYPAPLDPLFIGKILDVGYLTTMPGTREQSFYDETTADPDVIAYDEAHKSIASGVEIDDALTRLTLPAALNDTRNVRVPVLVVMGQEDTLLCGLLVSCAQDADVEANEKLYYTSAPSVTARTVPDTGHSLTLHPSSGQSFKLIDQWIRTH